MHLWLTHGCSVATLYGDDGEMQCAACRLDFKRLPLADLERVLRDQGWARVAEAQKTLAAERIVAAAIRQDGVVYAAPHHHQAIHYVALLTGKPTRAESGFVTSAGRYVGREEARRIALAAGQITDENTHHRTELRSEDLWQVTDYQLARLPNPHETAKERERAEPPFEPVACGPCHGAGRGWSGRCEGCARVTAMCATPARKPR